MKLTGRVAVVTGAGSGFGEGIAKLFAQEGAKVVVADIRGVEAERVAGEIVSGGGEAKASTTDVTKNDQVAAMVKLTLDSFGKLDVLVNNAGTTHKSQPDARCGRGDVRPGLRGKREEPLSFREETWCLCLQSRAGA